ncbi:HU family DNA-binding protein [Anaplasma marginale]|nr:MULTISPECIES: HU family DNA-binding protein [Anaplasma]ACM49189.1 Histone-like bacterial DNA-binding protein [Anaplasma marginale str. Florida]ACZ49392.1 DNA-binding protein HU [Anaplasma centrale str. Israel]AGZ78741.1 DNA-binding protein [Anaplasma marginale str. Gypsy Plains]ASI47570.1 DNA-binding protein [Anaplasma ovis str. Haibei]AXW83936.1 HU family DNA-binding protein [Anaplasma marginale]
MSKEIIVRALMSNLGFTKKDSSSAYDVVMSAVKTALETNHSIRLHNVGTLHVIQCAEKKYHNPKTGRLETLPPKRRVRFRSSRKLLDTVNV